MSAADIEAINEYINRTTASTTAARADQAAWQSWYKNLSFFDKMSDSTLQDAYAKRDRFNIDNNTPPIPSVPLTKEEADYFLNMPIVDVTGLSPEEAQKKVWSAKPVSPQPTSLTVSRATIRQGSKGESVKEWQRIVGGIAVDGSFGPATVTATKNWQKAHGLTADGVVGPQTWGTAYGDLPKLQPEKPAESTDASKKAAEGPAVVGKTYDVAPPPATGTTVKTTPKATATKVATKPTVTAKPATPKPPTSSATSTIVPQPLTTGSALASMLPTFSVPTWAKWVAGVLAVVGFGYGIKYHNDQKKLTERKRYRAENDEPWARGINRGL